MCPENTVELVPAWTLPLLAIQDMYSEKAEQLSGLGVLLGRITNDAEGRLVGNDVDTSKAINTTCQFARTAWLWVKTSSKPCSR